MDLPTKVVDTGDAAPSDPGTAHVHVVDDDASVRTAIARLLKAEGYLATPHRSAEAFLAESEPREHGCLVLDFAMPGLIIAALSHVSFVIGSGISCSHALFA